MAFLTWLRKIGIVIKKDIGCPAAKAVLATYAERFLVEVASLDVPVAVIDALAFALAELGAKELFKC